MTIQLQSTCMKHARIQFYLHIFRKALINKSKTEWLHLCLQFIFIDLNNHGCLSQWLNNLTTKKWYCQCGSLSKFIFRTGKILYSYKPVWSNTFSWLFTSSFCSCIRFRGTVQTIFIQRSVSWPWPSLWLKHYTCILQLGLFSDRYMVWAI